MLFNEGPGLFPISFLIFAFLYELNKACEIVLASPASTQNPHPASFIRPAASPCWFADTITGLPTKPVPPIIHILLSLIDESIIHI